MLFVVVSIVISSELLFTNYPIICFKISTKEIFFHFHQQEHLYLTVRVYKHDSVFILPFLQKKILHLIYHFYKQDLLY